MARGLSACWWPDCRISVLLFLPRQCFVGASVLIRMRPRRASGWSMMLLASLSTVILTFFKGCRAHISLRSVVDWRCNTFRYLQKPRCAPIGEWRSMTVARSSNFGGMQDITDPALIGLCGGEIMLNKVLPLSACVFGHPFMGLTSHEAHFAHKPSHTLRHPMTQRPQLSGNAR